MSGQYFPYALGENRATMAGTMRSEAVMCSKPHQNRSQFGSEAETRLLEVGIASNRRSACCGEYVPGSCTHRPSNHESHQHPKSASAAEGGGDDWG